MKLFLSLCVAVLVLTGCSGTGGNKPLTKAIFVTTVSTGVALGTDRYPESIPFLRVATPLVCAAAQGTNLSPAEITLLVQNSPAAQAVATAQGKLIFNGALTLYIALAEQANIENEDLQMYLSWTCESLQLGLPPEPIPANSRALQPLRAPRRELPPHVK